MYADVTSPERNGFVQIKQKRRQKHLPIKYIVCLIGTLCLLVQYFRIMYSATNSSSIFASSPFSALTATKSVNPEKEEVVVVARIEPHHEIEKEELEVEAVKVEQEQENSEELRVGQEEFDVTSMENTTLVDIPSSCAWSPFEDNIICTELLSQHMSAALIRTRKEFLSQQNAMNSGMYEKLPSVLHRRWLLFGDSTMVRLMFKLNQYLMVESVERYTKHRSTQRCNYTYGDDNGDNNSTDFQCSHRIIGRCERMEEFHLSRLPTIEEWRYPNFTIGEGPLVFGLENPYCTDCSGCESEVTACTILKDDNVDECTADIIRQRDIDDSVSSYTGPSYGGFFSVEFARDVELQTVEYSTTQENLISKYIADQWNTVDLVLEFGRPICVVSTGHHDVIVPNVTLDVYLYNVNWYLELLLQQCDYIIWTTNNAPLTDDYEQTVDGTYEWNMAVLHLLNSTANDMIRNQVFFLDVFNASITYPKDDNIHMNPSWYEKLASFFENIMKSLTV